MKRLLTIYLTFLSTLVFSESYTQITESITLNRAKELGLQVKVDVSDITLLKSNFYFSSYKVNFNKFKVCKPEYVKVRYYSDRGEILLDAKLERAGKWYEFSLGKETEVYTYLVANCKSGNMSVYHISMLEKND